MNARILFLISIFFSISSFLEAQDVDLQTQSAVDAFDSTISTIKGNLFIGGHIFQDEITDISNLINVDSVLGDLIISECEALTNLGGLNNILFVKRNVHIFANNVLADLDALQSLTSIRGNLRIDSNPLLENLNGLSNITSIEGLLWLFQLSLITKIDELANLESVGGITIFRLNALENINGLSGLSSVNGNLSIQYNAVLPNLIGLENISVIDGDFEIISNTNLESLKGISGLNYIGRSLLVFTNPNLEVCCDLLPVLLNPNAVGNLTAFDGNAPSCSSMMAIVNSNCASRKLASGKMIIDFDANGCDIDDVGFSYYQFEVWNNGSAILVQPRSQYYYLLLDSGINTIIPNHPNNKLSISPDTLILNWPADSMNLDNDFCITILEDYNDLVVTVIPISFAIPGFYGQYAIQYENKGTTMISGSVKFTFPDMTTVFQSAMPMPDQTSQGLLTWDYVNLQPFESRSIKVIIKLNSPMDTPPLNAGDVLSYVATINPIIDDENMANNSSDLNQTLVNSYDPNDKTCLEGALLNPELIGDYVHYLIRFENTGTANAIHVNVVDTIDSSLFEINTLEITSSSHECNATINGDVVSFGFDYINLPFQDPLNDGYVAFKIKTRDDLSIGDVLTNNADIYFDFNFPIRTNTATSEIKVVSTQNPHATQGDWVVYPNPANELLTFRFAEVGEYEIQIVDMNGQLLHRSVSTSSTQASLNISSIPDGLYFIQVIDESGNVSSKKFVKFD